MLAALALAVLAAAGADGVPEKGRARYLDAVEKLNAQQYGKANDVLNALAGEFPQVAEIFASRCSAQLGLKHWAAAEADCNYTLRLKQLPTAMYGLAVAEDGQAKYGQAVMHYRLYAGLPDALAQLKQQAMARADLLAAKSGAMPPPPPPPVEKDRVPVEKAQQQPQPPPSNPPPGGAKGQFVPGIPESGEGLLYVYRNLLPGVGTMTTLYVDDKRVGELWNDRYIELRLRPGGHTVTVKAAVTDTKRKEPEHSLQVEVVESELVYVKLEYAPQNDDVGFKPIVAGKQGRKEIRQDCELVFSKKL